MPYYQDNHIRIFNKDCRHMAELPDESVQCVVTSPPYWGLRKYSGEQELIWGDNHCEHEWGIKPKTVRHSKIWASNSPIENRPPEKQLSVSQGNFCSLCGAWRGQLGLEPMPEMYIEHTIEILREIRRVLRKDGVCFVNIADSYAGSGSPGGDFRDGKGGDEYLRPYNRKGGILKPKDLCLIPQRLAIAAQEDAWWVRSIIIWAKPNPMPESITDRPTESHEYILMLTKSAKYYWDQEAVREPYSPTERWGGETYRGAVSRQEYNQGLDRERSVYPDTGRNLRTVWEFPTQPGPSGAVRNFAVFPEKLPELCIKAATPEGGCCAKCGAPWVRVLEKKPSQFNIRVRDAKAGRAAPEEGYKATQEEIERYPGNHPDLGYSRTVGWSPTCKCNAPGVPSLVLDPMMGAGTTLWVAKKLNRFACGYELSQEYCQLAVERCRQQVLL